MDDPARTEPTDLFPNTRWTLVEEISGGGEAAERAMEELCAIYWQPVYAYARGSGLGPEDAEDLTQGFFHQLIGRESLAKADAARGRLRCYLLHALKHFRIDQHRRSAADKRGGGLAPISIDAADAERRLAGELAHHDDPERLFERRWALTLLDEAFARLEQEYVRAGKAALYEALRPVLVDGPDPEATYAVLGAELGMTEGAVQVSSHRLRKRFRRTLESVIAETVESPDRIDEELRHVLSALVGAS